LNLRRQEKKSPAPGRAQARRGRDGAALAFLEKENSFGRLGKLEDPSVAQDPDLDKDTLRAMTDAQFYAEFCHTSHDGVAEYWRSAASPGSRSSIRAPSRTSRSPRVLRAPPSTAPAGPRESAHVSFPLGIHPVGQIYARCAPRAASP